VKLKILNKPEGPEPAIPSPEIIPGLIAKATGEK